MITKEQLTTAVENAGLDEYDFVPEIIEDIQSELEGRYDPKQFFDDLCDHGCISGMIRKFICNSDCKEFYVKYIDSMEEFKEDIENEVGEPIANRMRLPHYTFVCWFCYEETANRMNIILCIL